MRLVGKGLWGKERLVARELLEYVPPVILTTEALRRFARFEIRYEELLQGCSEFP